MAAPSTHAVFNLLATAYPAKLWHYEAYHANGKPRHAITFAYRGAPIHDPFVTECRRFDKPSRYGLNLEHARLLRRHNRHYEMHVLGASVDLTQAFATIVAAIGSHPELIPKDYLDDFGFIEYTTGGGCMAYALFNPDGARIFVTDHDGSDFPDTLGAALVGLYRAESSEADRLFPDL